jgi:hypothetical protein
MLCFTVCLLFKLLKDISDVWAAYFKPPIVKHPRRIQVVVFMMHTNREKWFFIFVFYVCVYLCTYFAALGFAPCMALRVPFVLMPILSTYINYI